jgi:hypothetical protein
MMKNHLTPQTASFDPVVISKGFSTLNRSRIVTCNVIDEHEASHSPAIEV